MLNRYYDQERILRAVEEKQHREIIGGLWDEVGNLQFNFLITKGLKPHHQMLDIGCGSLRAGVKFVRYLEAGNYFGTDLNEALLQVGYDVEIAGEGLLHKLPRSNLITDGEFDFSWCREPYYDFAIAQSVFTHLPFNHMRICLERLTSVMKPEAPLFMTFFEIPADHPTHLRCARPGRSITFGDKDPYHYRFEDLRHAAKGLPWECRYIGEWGHPRAQQMAEFIRR